MNILLIEPDTKLAKTYQAALTADGHSVSCTASAQEAVHLADKTIPDLVLLELQLVGHNGIEFVYEFRSYTEWQDIPVILLTMVPPSALNITEEILKNLGIIDCLYKPATTLKQLTSTVNELS